ncbi:hypothetical protein BN1708_002302 [Verticillium longisporum]|uniref:tRNA wybutosine-synthesizing protein 4 n=1 Tax=Verticillium longisporum TaxID=100787 RepID=A0A0G4KQ94_VERLO|nr:hypothetical protein BN1708_002302 [Verticillium longisporum]
MTPPPVVPAGNGQQDGQSLDELVMGTNSSSIVSKRSVEKLYYPDEPHFYRFFVPRFQRRAPLVNRGYHLRIKVIDTIVRNFLREPTSRKKVIVNLGCGSDVLPWQCHARYPELAGDTMFVDVDFPDLMERKRNIVLAHPELSSLLGSSCVTGAAGSPILLQSALYSLIACDLRQPSVLQDCLSKVIGADTSDVSFLFVAEVSITYLETRAADEVIRWASSIGSAQFCLLEQLLPDGPEHPFAKTMMRHFSKMNTPLRSVSQYPTLADQHRRFESRGWATVKSWPLWEAWADDYFMTAAERNHLDSMEPFDEWEEFALFGSHYFVLQASNQSTGEPSTPRPPQEQPSTLEKWRIAMRLDEPPKGESLRRFGAAVQIAVPKRPEHLCHILGQGPGSRLSSLDVHSISEEVIQATSSGNGPSQRVCFTLTDLGSAGVMLAGGRASPTAPSKETWIYTASSGRWYRSHDLPMPSFRHSAVRLGSSSLALVVGGKTDKHNVATACHVFDPKIGWRTCKLRGTCPAVFGATLIDCPKTDAAAYTGALIGGMHEDGTCNQSTFFWELDMDGSSDLSISFRRGADADPSLTGHHSSLHRFGANCLPTPDGCFLLFGGVTAGSQLPQDQDILVLKMGANGFNAVACLVDVDEKRSLRPFFIGSSVVYIGHHQYVILGGGATCYGFGGYWSRGTYSIMFDTANDMVEEPAAGKAAPLPVRYAHTNDI